MAPSRASRLLLVGGASCIPLRIGAPLIHCRSMSDPMLAYTHPEMVRRLGMLTRRMWAKSWDLQYSSTSRSEAQQREWYALYLAGQWPAIVADPDRVYCTAPSEIGGWIARGSMHQLQADGYSHAVDASITGPTYYQFHVEARACGLVPVEPTEWWHLQFWDVSGMFDVLEDDDMTPEQLGLVKDPNNPDDPRYGIMLIETIDVHTSPATLTEKWYPYNIAIKLIHQRGKTYDALHP